MPEAVSFTLSPDEAGPDKEEVASAAEVLQTLLKTSKAFRIYLPNNPLLARFIAESVAKTTEHLRRHGRYQLDVEQFELFYAGKRIHENRDPKESVAFRMYSDGIRSVAFAEGIGGDEICAFLDIVGQDRAADTDDDIVTLLWMKDLPHVSYLLAEDFLEFDGEGGALPAAASQKEGIRRVHEAPAEPASRLVPREIQPITAEETAALGRERDAEESRGSLQEVMAILFSILAGEKDLEVFRDFLEIVENLVGNLIHAGKAAEALRLIRFLRKMQASDRVPAAKRELIGAAAGQTVTADAVLALQSSIDGDPDFSPDDLPDFIRFFGRRHLGTTCELLGRVQAMKMRKAIISALLEIGREAPGELLPFLRDQRWYLVRNIVFLLNLIGTREGLDAVIPLVTHRETRVRKEAFAFLQRFSEARARLALMKYLQDESMALRIRALQTLSAAKFPPAFKAVAAIIAAKEFAEKELEEKLALYEALGELGADSVVPQLRQMIMKRYWFGRSREGEAVACAVAALRKARTPASLQVLTAAAAERRGSELGALISQVLRELEAGTERAAAAGEGDG